MARQDVVNQQQFYQLFSSQASIKYLIESFFGEVQFDDERWIDIHDKRVMTLMKLPRAGQIRYNNSVPATTHSVMAYKTSSLWWLIVNCSDYTHGHEIPNNTIIEIPTYNDIATAFKEIYTGLRNQVVTI